MSESGTPFTLYLDRTGELDLDDLPEKQEERGLEGFGTQPFGTSSFGLGLRSELVYTARRFDADRREGLDFRRGVTDVGDFRVDIPGGFELHEWTEADAAILDADAENLAFIGKVTDFSHSTSRHVATLEGPGPGYPLRRGSATVTYEATPAWRAFEDYGERFLPEWDIDVTEPRVEPVFRERELATVAGVRDDLEQHTNITETDPLTIDDGAITPLQTAWTTEAEDDDSRSISGDDSGDAGDVTNDRYSMNQGVRLASLGDWIEYIFEPAYTIPQLRVGVRCQADDPPGTEVFLVDRTGEQESLGMLVEEHRDKGLQWIDMRQFGDVARNIDDVTRIRFEAVTTPASGGWLDLDVVAPYDMRFEYTFDNEGTVNDAGVRHLDGPEYYPDEVLFEADRAGASANIYAARIEADFDDTSGRQAIELSNDGRLWQGATNTDRASVDFEGVSFGYGVTPRFAMGRTDAVRDDATPRQGYQTQRLSGWTIWGSGDDLQVVEEKELTDNHLPNLQWLADRGNMVFYIPVTRPDEPREIVAFHPGQIEERLPVGASDWGDLQSEKSTGPGYANYVVVEGKRDDHGERPRGVAFDEEEIKRRGGWDDPDAVVTHTDTDATITTETDAGAKADQLLEEMVGEDDFAGAIEQLPVAIHDDAVHIKHHPDLPLQPGIAYRLSEWGTYTTLEEVRVEEGTNGTHLILDFDRSDDVLDEIVAARRRADDAHKAQ